MTDYPGIDYSGPGSGVNRDPETGIRYGVIPVHELRAPEEFVPDYGPPTCGRCGNELVEWDCEKHDEYDYADFHGCCDFACEHCLKSIDSSDAYGDEPVSYVLDDGTYRAEIDSSGDVWVFSSPYYTRAQFCSPCAPGAGHLSSPCSHPDAPKVFCLGHDFFESGVAPYPVYDVVTGWTVAPPSRKDGGA